MEGINFMALIDGARLADQDNKADETYWRKAAREDREDAYTEETRGYQRENMQDQRDYKDVARAASTAWDVLRNTASAKGIPLHQAILEGQGMTLEGATPYMQAKFSEVMNNAVQTKLIPDLLRNKDYATADALSKKLGMTSNANNDMARAYADPRYADNRIQETFGLTPDADGNYTLADGKKYNRMLAYNLLMGSGNNAFQTLDAFGQREKIEAERAANTAALAAKTASNATSADQSAAARLALSGAPLAAIPPEMQEAVVRIRANISASGPAKTTGTPPMPNGYAGTAVNLASLTEDLPAMPAAELPAMPSASPSGPLNASNWREALTANPATASLEEQLNHKSTDDLSKLRIAVITAMSKGQVPSGTTPATISAYLKTIDDEIYSRHAAQTKQLSRGAK
jgi:hypothetical protein